MSHTETPQQTKVQKNHKEKNLYKSNKEQLQYRQDKKQTPKSMLHTS